MFTAPMALAVNQDLLSRASLTVPTASWTWENFTEYATKLTQREGDDVKVYGAPRRRLGRS
jgi:multiple sugar transport system substrate-binding protein